MRHFSISCGAALAGLALAGCNPAATQVGATYGGAGTAVDSYNVDYDEGTDTITVDNGVAAIDLARNTDLDSGAFNGYENIGNYALYTETPSGEGRVAVVATPDVGVEGARFARLDTTTLPGNGNVTYSGDYAGFVNDSGGTAVLLIRGDMTMLANFSDSTILGEITNRQDGDSPSTPFSDVLLNLTDLDDGSFIGTTTGGSGGGGTAGAGDYAGLIVGPDGREVVGAVRIPHDFSGTAYTEYGGFIGD